MPQVVMGVEVRSPWSTRASLSSAPIRVYSAFRVLKEGSAALVQMQLARQDQDLEELGTHVERVGETATIINEELRSQNR